MRDFEVLGCAFQLHSLASTVWKSLCLAGLANFECKFQAQHRDKIKLQTTSLCNVSAFTSSTRTSPNGRNLELGRDDCFSDGALLSSLYLLLELASN